MHNKNPLFLFYQLFSDLFLIVVQIAWLTLLFLIALIPCGAAITPSLPCKTTPWNSANCRHKCRCLPLTATPFLRSTSFGMRRTWSSQGRRSLSPPLLTLNPQPPLSQPTNRRGRGARRLRTRRSQVAVSPATLTARLERHLLPHLTVPTPSPAETPPPPYEPLESPPHQQDGSANDECSESTSPGVGLGQCSSTLPPPRREASPHSPAPPPRRRRRHRALNGRTPTAPPPFPCPANSDTE